MKRLCINCKNEIDENNEFVKGFDFTVAGIPMVIRSMGNGAKHICKHCIIDGVIKLDDRPKPYDKFRMLELPEILRRMADLNVEVTQEGTIEVEGEILYPFMLHECGKEFTRASPEYRRMPDWMFERI